MLGLVLEGGAMRGMYTAGVLDVFMENDITVDCTVGVSAGALFGVNLPSKQSGRVIRYNKRFNSDKNYMGLFPLFKEGNIVSTRMAYDIVPRQLDPFDDETYKKSKIPFYAVVTNAVTGKAEYIQIRSVFEQMDTLRASGSMPFVSKPVRIGDKEYLDGGIADSIPVQWMQAQGCDKMIVILTREMGYSKKPMSRALIRACYHDRPELAKTLKNRHVNYNESLALLSQMEQDGKAFVIRPTVEIKISKIEKDPDKLQAVYELGVRDAKAWLPRLKAFIEK